MSGDLMGREREREREREEKIISLQIFYGAGVSQYSD
jgi:hypothetical protein